MKPCTLYCVPENKEFMEGGVLYYTLHGKSETEAIRLIWMDNVIDTEMAKETRVSK